MSEQHVRLGSSQDITSETKKYLLIIDPAGLLDFLRSQSNLCIKATQWRNRVKPSIFRGYFLLFYQGRVTEVWPLFTGWPLFGVGL